MKPAMNLTHTSTLRQLLVGSRAEQVTDEIEPQSRYVQFEVLSNIKTFKHSRLRPLFLLQFYLQLDEPFCTEEQRQSAIAELLDYVLDLDVNWQHHEGILGIDIKPDQQRGMHHVDYYEQARGIDGTSYFLPGDNSGSSRNSLLAALKASLRMVLMQSLNDT